MAGDLEDFLRRAAQRRQQKTAQQKEQAGPPRRTRPEYSNAKTERIARPVEPDDPIVTAEIVDEVAQSRAARSRQAQARENEARQAHARRLEQAERAAAEAKAEIAAALQTAGNRAAGRTQLAARRPEPLRELVRGLLRPGGIQQAILMREIMDRPEHRW